MGDNKTRQPSESWGTKETISTTEKERSTMESKGKDNDPGITTNPAGITEQEKDYETETLPPLKQRLRHWHRWKIAGLLVAVAGVAMLIGGHLAHTGRAMQVGGFFILCGAIIYVVGTIGSWITRERPLD